MRCVDCPLAGCATCPAPPTTLVARGRDLLTRAIVRWELVVETILLLLYCEPAVEAFLALTGLPAGQAPTWDHIQLSFCSVVLLDLIWRLRFADDARCGHAACTTCVTAGALTASEVAAALAAVADDDDADGWLLDSEPLPDLGASLVVTTDEVSGT